MGLQQGNMVSDLGEIDDVRRVEVSVEHRGLWISGWSRWKNVVRTDESIVHCKYTTYNVLQMLHQQMS